MSFSIGFWVNSNDVSHWWPVDDHSQVPRKGDTVWLETDSVNLQKFSVEDVQWSFKDKALGISRHRQCGVEVWVKPIENQSPSLTNDGEEK